MCLKISCSLHVSNSVVFVVKDIQEYIARSLKRYISIFPSKLFLLTASSASVDRCPAKPNWFSSSRHESSSDVILYPPEDNNKSTYSRIVQFCPGS